MFSNPSSHWRLLWILLRSSLMWSGVLWVDFILCSKLFYICSGHKGKTYPVELKMCWAWLKETHIFLQSFFSPKAKLCNHKPWHGVIIWTLSGSTTYKYVDWLTHPCMLGGKENRDRRRDMAALKRALWNKLTNEKAVGSQVVSADWNSWLAAWPNWSDMCPVGTIAMLDFWWSELQAYSVFPLCLCPWCILF